MRSTLPPTRGALFIPILLGVFLLGVYGCSSPDPDKLASPATPNSDEPADHDLHVNASETGTSPMTEKMPELKGLSPEDHKLAMAQHICPVTAEMLGTMGTPEKINVEGKAVFICCSGCEKKLLADPEKYLAALKDHGVTPPAF
ncbi:hypothetical protein FF011L_09220 [Roseimaritima multifibrata]|uniref:YHS domain protein n=1 Tax=Roseimaritima multifibrata TaxID=1930274 RepID=A0A517MBD4_9BACT|nr:hypothetical protein [Roseimaritima multifibrata]QDS92185.1 hypothetical protein FF011L_09220 [Roseimaritima multifibrata]